MLHHKVVLHKVITPASQNEHTRHNVSYRCPFCSLIPLPPFLPKGKDISTGRGVDTTAVCCNIEQLHDHSTVTHKCTPAQPSPFEMPCHTTSYACPRSQPNRLATLKACCATLLLTHAAWSRYVMEAQLSLSTEKFFQSSLRSVRIVQNCVRMYLGPTDSMTEENRKAALGRTYMAVAKLNQQTEVP